MVIVVRMMRYHNMAHHCIKRSEGRHAPLPAAVTDDSRARKTGGHLPAVLAHVPS